MSTDFLFFGQVISFLHPLLGETNHQATLRQTSKQRANTKPIPYIIQPPHMLVIIHLILQLSTNTNNYHLLKETTGNSSLTIQRVPENACHLPCP